MNLTVQRDSRGNFVELKASVFKKFEAENLFQD